MTETAQPETAAESEVALSVEDAAHAFKVHLGQAEPADRARDEKGRFASPASEEEEEEIEAEGDAPEAESQNEEDADEAADEAQPEAVDLPPSWPAELAEEWSSLPAPLQDTIVRREAERETAVNAKFQEAANVKKANEALVTEAQANRQHFAEATEFALSLINPQKPSATMLDQRSSDYNPDEYHLRMANYEQNAETIRTLYQHRQQAVAQAEVEDRQAREQAYSVHEASAFPKFVADVPELNDPAKAQGLVGEIVKYAVAQGVPEEAFADPEQARFLTSTQLHIAWKAMKYDEMVKAKGRVQPKAAKPAAPPVRPGVTTPRSAVDASRRKQNFDRLARSGSVEDGAAVFKDYFKGR